VELTLHPLEFLKSNLTLGAEAEAEAVSTVELVVVVDLVDLVVMVFTQKQFQLLQVTLMLLVAEEVQDQE
jgi:hypothetical protein